MCKRPWYVYLARCRDGSLYAGITTDLERRIEEHNHSSKGARYTRARRPVTLAYWEICGDRAAASRREHALKQLSRKAKQSLVSRYEGNL